MGILWLVLSLPFVYSQEWSGCNMSPTPFQCCSGAAKRGAKARWCKTKCIAACTAKLCPGFTSSNGVTCSAAAPPPATWSSYYGYYFQSFPLSPPQDKKAAEAKCAAEDATLAKVLSPTHAAWLSSNLGAPSSFLDLENTDSNDGPKQQTQSLYQYSDGSYVNKYVWKGPVGAETEPQPGWTLQCAKWDGNQKGIQRSPCQAVLPSALCMKLAVDEHEGKRYHWVEVTRNQDQAKQMCTDHDPLGTLLEVKNVDDQKFVTTYIHNHMVWLGAKNDKYPIILTKPDPLNWKWSRTGESVPDFWLNNEPNHGKQPQAEERCLAIYKKGGPVAQFADEICTNDHYTVCEVQEDTGFAEFICDGQSKKLSCPKGQAINITSVFYGRVSRNRCPSINIDDNKGEPWCWEPSGSRKAPGYVITQCEGIRSCSLSNVDFWSQLGYTKADQPCGAAMSKYLHIRFACVSAPQKPLYTILREVIIYYVTPAGSVLGLSGGGAAALTGAGHQLALLNQRCATQSKREALQIQTEANSDDFFLTKHLDFVQVSSFRYADVAATVFTLYFGVIILHGFFVFVFMKVKYRRYFDAAASLKFPYVEEMLWDMVVPMVIFCSMQMSFKSSDNPTSTTVWGPYNVFGVSLACLLFIAQFVIIMWLFHEVRITDNLTWAWLTETPNGFENIHPPIKLQMLLPKWYWCCPDDKGRFKQVSYYCNSASFTRWGWLYSPLNGLVLAVQVVIPFLQRSCKDTTLIMCIIASVRLLVLLLWRPYHDVFKNVLAIIIQACVAVVSWSVFVKNATGKALDPTVEVVITLVLLVFMVVFFVWTVISAFLRSRYVKKIWELDDAYLWETYGEEDYSAEYGSYDYQADSYSYQTDSYNHSYW